MGGGSVPTGHGLVAGQVAEIIVTLDGGPGRRGSGYRVGPAAVLTAAHVVECAVAVQVRFDADLPGEWIAEVLSCWADPRGDLAVLTIAPRAGEAAVGAARFGRIGGDRAAVLAARAVGFPRFKLKTDDGATLDADRPWYRDSHQAEGSVAVLSNRREGTLELTVPPPDRDPDLETSSWEGMSGAAVWVSYRIVGVVAKHHRSDGLGRLAATRLDLAFAALDLHRQAELRTLLHLPDVLPDVVPLSVGEWVRTAYQAQVRDIAPDWLLDREAELDELVAFCAGDQPYAWWQAGPWAGKSALMSWFVLHPPAGVDVVSFFVTARLAGQSDSHACTDALMEQLAALLGESPATLLTAGARRGTLLRLLDDAANRACEAGRRLLLVIDGLDEDSGTAIKSSATAAGGGLTLDDLEELTQQSRFEIKHLLGGLFGRSVGGRTHPSSAGYPDERVYLFTHETLRFVAQEQFGNSLAGYCSQLHVWADTYQQRRWPTDTPHYLLRSYTSMLAISGDLTRLVACAIDQARHDRMRDLSGGDALAFTEIGTAQQLILAQPDPDLTSLALIAVQRDHLTDRNSNVPTNLPAVWAMLGQPTRAEALATGIPPTSPRSPHPENPRAEALATGILRQEMREAALAQVARAAVASGDHDRVEELIGQITWPDPRAWALARLAGAVAAGGDYDRAARLVDEAEAIFGHIDLTEPTEEIAGLIGAVADDSICDRAEAEALIGQLIILKERPGQSIRLAEAIAAGGSRDRPARLTENAEALIGQTTDQRQRARALAWLAPTVAADGDRDLAARAVDMAEVLVGQITDPHQQAEALAWLAEAMVASGDCDRAARLADRAEALVKQTIDPNRRAAALEYLVKAVTTAGDYDRAEKLIGLIIDPGRRASELAALVKAVSAAGNHDRASRLAGEARALTKQISNRFQRQSVRLALAGAAADHDRAEPLTKLALDREGRVEALARRAAEAAAAGEHDRAIRLAEDAKALTEQLTPQYLWPEALAQLAGMLVETGKKRHRFQNAHAAVRY